MIPATPPPHRPRYHLCTPSLAPGFVQLFRVLDGENFTGFWEVNVVLVFTALTTLA